MVWAWGGDNLKLRKRGSSDVLIFDRLQPTFRKYTHYMKLTLSSHQGKGVCFSGKTKYIDKGGLEDCDKSLKEYLTLGSA